MVCWVGDDSPRKIWSLSVLSSPYPQHQLLLLVMLPSKHGFVFVRRAVTYLRPPRLLATKHLRPLSKQLHWSRSIHLLPSILLRLPLPLFAELIYSRSRCKQDNKVNPSTTRLDAATTAFQSQWQINQPPYEACACEPRLVSSAYTCTRILVNWI